MELAYPRHPVAYWREEWLAKSPVSWWMLQSSVSGRWWIENSQESVVDMGWFGRVPASYWI